MKLFTKLKEFYYETWNMYRQIGLDKTNKKQFIKTITEECADQKSEFIKKNLKVGDDGESIVYITSVPQEVQNYGQDFVIMDKLNENTYFITDFLKRIVGFNEYVSLPEYYHIEDPSADEVSLTYLVIWRFNPMVDDKLKKKLYGYPIAIGSAIITGICSLFFFL